MASSTNQSSTSRSRWGPKIVALAASSSSKVVVSVFVVLLVVVFFISGWIDTSSFVSSKTSLFTTVLSSSHKAITTPPSKTTPYIPFTCPNATNTTTPTCQPPTPTPTPTPTPPPLTTCPSYFRWIHEDLRRWESTGGIDKAAVESGKDKAHFRFLVVDGRAYLDRYRGAFETRDVFTLWGLLQLLRHYPGRVPDLDVMFNLGDSPVVRADDYGPEAVPPPLFRYCKNASTLDIVFPDWSFWGWPEVNIKPWDMVIEEIKQGNQRVKWKHREPYAYWKGNPWVARTRQDLMTCNVSDTKDWNARLYSEDWVQERKGGFKSSDLSSQCTYRYKIYIEGRAWSVSEKYILACNSPTLLVNTGFQDFYTRGLMPGRHYLPIRDDDKCRSIKSAVDWGNSHQKKAQDIGKAANIFIEEDLKMDNLYDYMLHLLTAYSKLLTYKPSVPADAVELCLASVACPREGRTKEYMMASMVRAPREAEPCSMPPPFGPGELQEFLKSKADAIAQVERWQ